MIPANIFPPGLIMTIKSRSISLASFSSLSLLIFLMYVKLGSRQEEQAVLHVLPKEVVCPDTVPKVLNTSHPRGFSGGIYFVETSDRTTLTFQAMCAVESAARANPAAKVAIMMKGLTDQSKLEHNNFGMSLLRCFSNVDFVPMDYRKLFDNTPLSTWYSDVESSKEFVDYPTLSDACRLAILWKKGGVYLDTDFIILKNFQNLTNAMAMQSLYVLNGAFITFQPQHKFIKLCMKDFVANYNYWIYGHQGPQLLTRIFKRWCASHRLREKKSCRGVNMLSKETFYPVDWQDWKKYFEPIDPKDMKALLKDTYGVHLWNKKSQGMHLEVGSFLEQLQSEYCPTTNNLIKMYSQEAFTT